MGNIGSHLDITSERQRHQAKNAALANIQSYFQRVQAGPVMRAGQPAGKRQSHGRFSPAPDVSGVYQDLWFSQGNFWIAIQAELALSRAS
jgi:hypothetical protein